MSATENQLKNLNRSGRPKGVKNNKTLLQEALIQDATDIMVKEFPKIVQTAVDLAKQGDTTAMKMIFDRIIPARKAIEHNQSKGNTGVTIVVQGIAQVEEGRPVLEHEADEPVLLETADDDDDLNPADYIIDEEEIYNER